MPSVWLSKLRTWHIRLIKTTCPTPRSTQCRLSEISQNYCKACHIVVRSYQLAYLYVKIKLEPRTYSKRFYMRFMARKPALRQLKLSNSVVTSIPGQTRKWSLFRGTGVKSNGWNLLAWQFRFPTEEGSKSGETLMLEVYRK